METVIDIGEFPQELLIEILARLPAKSLVRFTKVSKSWYALITSSNFIFTHLARIRNESPRGSSLLLTRYYAGNEGKEHYTLHPDNDDFNLKSWEIEFPLRSHLGFYRIVGSCDGLLCLCDNMFWTYRTQPIVIWNPSIQKLIELPLPSFDPYSKTLLLCFGCDLQRLDYKVVRIVLDTHTLTPKMEVFSLSSRRWRNVPTGSRRNFNFSSSPVLVNGVVHWLAPAANHANIILGFDLKDEIFIEILLPESLTHQITAILCPMINGGRLAVMMYNGYKGYCDLWVMEEYGNVESWEMVCRAKMEEGMGRVIGFRKNGDFLATMAVDEMFVSDPSSGVLVSFDPMIENVGGAVKDLEVFGKVSSIYVEHFLESLVLLEGKCRF